MTQTTVQALLNVLVGRDPNEIIMIENNELRVVATVNLLNVPATGVQLVQDIIRNSATKADPVLRALVNPPVPTGAGPKVKNANRAWKPEDLKTMADLRAKGAGFEDIGKVFGRTAKAIECQLNYLRNGRPQKESGSVALL